MQDLSKLVDFESGRQCKSIFHDQDIYDLEMERIYGKCWLFLAHESQIPKPGDFMRTFMGEDEVLVIRQSNNSVRAFLNLCNHRGNRVCKADFGNQKQFTCNYHGWSYRFDGDLVGVPLEEKAYYNKIDKSSLGLLEVDQVSSYKGLVFGNFDANAISLEDYLGDAKYYLDVWLDGMPGGSELLGSAQKVELMSNWKIPHENVGGDGYHFGWTHAGAMAVTTSQEVSGIKPGNADFDLAGGASIALQNGHTVLASTDGGIASGYGFYPDPSLAIKYLDENRPTAIQRLGKFRGERLWGSQLNIAIYPNLNLLPGLNWARVYHPKGPGRYEQWTWAMAEKAMPQEMKEYILENQIRTFGPAGLFDNDDGDNFDAIGEMGRGRRAREANLYTVMGMGKERTHAELPGVITESIISEQNQRNMYRQWLDLMQSETWEQMPKNYAAELAALREKTEKQQGAA